MLTDADGEGLAEARREEPFAVTGLHAAAAPHAAAGRFRGLRGMARGASGNARARSIEPTAPPPDTLFPAHA